VLGYAHPPDSILINALVLRNLPNLRVDDNPAVGSSVLLIGVARIQSNFEPMRKQIALFLSYKLRWRPFEVQFLNGRAPPFTSLIFESPPL